MKECVTDPVVPPTTQGTLADIPARNARTSPDRVAFRRPRDGGWADVTAGAFQAEVRALAKGFVAAGIGTGDRVAIMSRTRYEWTVVDFALWTAGAVGVPVYETSSPDQLRWILQDSGAVGIVVESASHRGSVDEVRADLTDLRHIWEMDAGDLATLSSSATSVSDETLDAQRASLGPRDLATVIYTSGTTGRPKGCELTHGNFLDLSANTIPTLPDFILAPNAATLLFLPLAHVFARLIEVVCVDAMVVLGHSADVKNILADFASFQPTFVLAVPRVFEKIYNSSEAKATAAGKGRIFTAAADTAIAWSTALEQGGPSLGLRLKHALFDRLVYGKLRAAMGGKVEWAISGGAPLGARLGHFFRGIGLTIIEGYGLTETTAPACANLPRKVKIGTVGPPLPGVAVRIAEDGEILIRGVNVFARYRNNEAATREAFVDGWFRTGDIGSMDEDGYLTITGRKKEILVTAGGKNVAPAVLEDQLRAHPIVSQCIVVGDQRPFIGALITLDEEMYPVWAANHDLDGVSLHDARTNEAVLAELQTAVDAANASVSRAESIRQFRVLEGDFTEANGYLTPSLKLRRAVVMKDFANEVEALYSR